MNGYKNGDPEGKGAAMRASIAKQQSANRRRNRGNVEPADWKEAHPDKLAAAIVAITSHGFAIRFGYTKDGGAFYVGIVGDGEPFSEFIRPTEDIDLYLDNLRANYSDE